MPAKHPDKCCYPGCKRWATLIYLDRPLCDECWAKIDINPNKLRVAIGLPPFPEPPAPRQMIRVKRVRRKV